MLYHLLAVRAERRRVLSPQCQERRLQRDGAVRRQASGRRQRHQQVVHDDAL